MDLVMNDLEMIDTPNMMLFGMSGPINMVSENPNGLGYSVYYYEQFMAFNEKLKLCGVNDVIPSYDTIAGGEYEYVTEVYTVIREDTGTNSTAYQLWEWLQTDDGQKVVRESGYVGVS